MNVKGERILIFGDSLSHHGSDGGPEIWDVNAGSNRTSSAPGDLLGSLLLEQGAQAVRIDANVGRSASNFWRGNAKYQYQPAAQLLAADQAFRPTKVIVMLGTNDADVGAMDVPSITKIRDAYKAMGAEVWAVGPPSFTSSALNTKASQVYLVMADVFGAGRLIDTRTMTLSTLSDRAGDGVHFRPTSAKQLAINIADKLLTTAAPKPPWMGLALGFGGVLAFGMALLWVRSRSQQLGLAEGDNESDDDDDELQGEKVPAYFVNPDDGEVIEVDQQTAVFRPKRNDLLPGGKAAGRPDRDFDPKALARGLKVELEHTNDREIAKEIAKDHLAEDPEYYTKLATIHLDGADDKDDRAAFWFEMLRDKKTSLKELKDEIVESKQQITKYGKKKPPAKDAPNHAYQNFCRSIEHAWAEARGREEAIAKFTKKPIELTPRPTTCPAPMVFKAWDKDLPPLSPEDDDYEWNKKLPKPVGYDERRQARDEHERLSKEEYATYKARGLWGAVSFSDVRKQLKQLGVDEMISERADEIHVGKIVVPKTARGAGTGTKAMQLLVDYADRAGKRITLTPSKDFGASSVARLKTFYKRFGFVENKGRNKDYTTRETMIRAPR